MIVPRAARVVALLLAGTQAAARSAPAPQVRDASSGEILVTLGSTTTGTWIPAAQPDGKRMAIPCGDGSIRIVEIATGRQLACIDAHPGNVELVAWGPRGERLASCGGRVLKVWDAGNGGLLFAVRAFARSMAHDPHALFSPDGERILSWGRPGASFAIRQVDEGRLLASSDQVPWWAIHAAAWSPDSESVAIGGPGVRFYDGRTGEATGVHLEHEAIVTDLAFGPAGEYMVTSDVEGRGYIWSLSTGKRLHTLQHPRGFLGPEQVEFVAVSPDGSLAVTAAGSFCRVLCWEMETGRLRWNVSAGWYDSCCEGELKLRFNPDGTRLYVSESWGESVRVLDVRTGQPIDGLDTLDGVRDLSCTADDRYMLELLHDAVRVRDGRTLRELYNFVPYEGGAHLTIVPTLHYQGNPTAARQARLEVRGKPLPLDSYASLLNDPEAVIASIAGEELERPALPLPPRPGEDRAAGPGRRDRRGHVVHRGGRGGSGRDARIRNRAGWSAPAGRAGALRRLAHR